MNRLARSMTRPLDTWPRQYLWAGLWAVLWALCYPRANVWPLAHVCLAPLMVLAMDARSNRRLITVVYPVSVAWWGAMLYWLIPVTGPGQAGLAAYMALYPLAFALIVRQLRRRSAMPMVLAAPTAWVALEQLRGVLLTGFPWFMLGHSQPTWLIQVADLGGAHAASFLPAMGGATAAVALRPSGRPVLPWAAMWAAGVIACAGYGAWRSHQWFEPEMYFALRVALVQSNVPQSNKDSGRADDDAATFGQLEQLTRQAAASVQQASPANRLPAGSLLVAWPETIVPGGLNDQTIAIHRQAASPRPDYRGRIESLSRELGIWLLVGSHALEDWQPGADGYWRVGRRYNSAYLFSPDGRLVGRYDKMHRVPFGEYIPWVDSSPRLKQWMLALTPYDHDYSLAPGRQATVFQVNDGQRLWRIGTPICYEDVVPGVARAMAGIGDAKRADALINLTNDGWYAGLAQGPQHEQIARLRCVENRVPMARAVNTGASAFIDSCGRVTGRVQVGGRTQNVAGAAVGELRLDPRRTLYSRIGDAFGAGCVLATAAMLLAGWWIGRGKADH